MTATIRFSDNSTLDIGVRRRETHVRCNKHRNYQAVDKPRANCEACYAKYAHERGDFLIDLIKETV